MTQKLFCLPLNEENVDEENEMPEIPFSLLDISPSPHIVTTNYCNMLFCLFKYIQQVSKTIW